MKLIKIDDNTFLNSDEVCSVEYDCTYKYGSESPSDTCLIKDFEGTRVILKNGRKVFIKNIMPDEIVEKLGL